MNNTDLALAAESVSTTNPIYFIAVYLLVLIYCCFGLAVVCDVYFVPALQKLSYTYDLPADIAGSTLMALGASVPELFASLVGVFITEDDIGTGSIIGSSSFNLIAVPAACSFVASATFGNGALELNPMPVTRNSAFYAITILVLLLIIKDNQVDIPESLILLFFFVMYMTFMIFCAQSKKLHKQKINQALDQSTGNNQNIYKKNHSESLVDSAINSDTESMHSDKSCSSQRITDDYRRELRIGIDQYRGVVVDEKTPLVATSAKGSIYPATIRFPTMNEYEPLPTTRVIDQPDHYSVDLGIAIKNSTALMKSCDIDKIQDRLTGKDRLSKSQHCYNNLDNQSISIPIKCNIDITSDCITKNSNKINTNKNHNDDDHSNWISSNWILVPMFPLTLSMKVLMPGKFKTTFWTIWSFLISISLIGALTYVAVWMVHLLGQLLGIPDTVAGMTILSWGTGIPELIASIVLIRKTGEADMAISNTIGSNVIDVSFCLSLPWIVKCLMNKSYGLAPIVEVQSVALPWSTFLLLISVVLLLIILKLHDWKLCYGTGIWLMISYTSFVIGSIALEYSIPVS